MQNWHACLPTVYSSKIQIRGRVLHNSKIDLFMNKWEHHFSFYFFSKRKTNCKFSHPPGRRSSTGNSANNQIKGKLSWGKYHRNSCSYTLWSPWQHTQESHYRASVTIPLCLLPQIDWRIYIIIAWSNPPPALHVQKLYSFQMNAHFWMFALPQLKEVLF